MQIKNSFLAFFAIVLFASCHKSDLNEAQRPAEPIETESPVLQPVSININNKIGGYYRSLPVHYAETTKSYPILIFIHGAGQYGNGINDLPLLLTDGVPQLLDEKRLPASFEVNGETHSFIFLVPQFKSAPGIADMKAFFDYALKSYRIDSSRIYYAGFSLGGLAVCDFAAAYSSNIAAIVAMSGVSDDNEMLSKKCQSIAQSKLPVWVLHNENDEVIPVEEAEKFISLIKDAHPPIPPKLTVLPGEGLANHDSWTRATDPLYKEDGFNIYEWMLQYRR
jgi:predicted peptidase